MTDAIKTIKAQEPTQDILDYRHLKNKGLEELQKLAGNVWTDYNHHDPGITVLEILSYALTELGFRSQYPVEDILSGKDHLPHTLFPPNKILPSKAITLKDYHKIILDIEGIKDVIIYSSPRFPEFNGIYSINIEVQAEFDNEKKRKEIVNLINDKVHRNRNLCETFDEITFLEHVPVSFNIDIDVNDQQDLAGIFLDMYREITEYLAPSVTFYSLDELLEKGYQTEEIFTGPLLENGFVLESDFERIDSRNKIFASDIIHFIMDIPGVDMIKKFQIINENDEIFRWFLGVEKGKAFKLDLKKSAFRFFKVGKEVKIEEDLSQEIKKIDEQEDTKLLYKRLKFIREKGVSRNLSSYYSIQHDFPQIYGIGELGLLPSESPRRKAQAKQFKGFLMFFEQILVNFFAQLEDLALLFSISEIKNTYSSLPLLQVPGVEYIYREFVAECMGRNVDLTDKKVLKKEWKLRLDKFQEKLSHDLKEIVEDRTTFYDRRNRLLDHLLARLAFRYSEYRFDFEADDELNEALIEHKTHILDNFVQLNEGRSQARIMLSSELDKPDNISGLEYRIKNLLKLQSSSTEFPFDFFKTGVFTGPQTNLIDDPEDMNFSFVKLIGDTAVDALFNYGSHKTNYKTVGEEGIYKIQLTSNEGDVIAITNKEFTEEDKAVKVIDDIIRRLNDISQACECIHVIERVLYRPHVGMNYFTFSIWLNKDSVAFINEGYMTFEGRNKKIRAVLSSGVDPSRYTYMEQSNQFKILLRNENGETLLISHRFFNTEKEVEKEINDLVEMFQRITNGQVDRNKHFRYYTKHYDIFNLASNPYSFIATILIPSWPIKFQNQAFRTLLENKIREETPAHVFPDIKWVGIRHMINIVDLTNEYDHLLEQSEIDFERLEETSEKLFRYFVRL